MKVSPECVPCLLNRLLYETNLVDPSCAGTVMKEACGILGTDLTTEICSAELATRVHRRTYEILGCRDPYEKLKKIAMAVCLRLEEKAKALIKQSSYRLHTAVLCAIVGNVLDFGIVGGMTSPDDLVASFDSIYNEGLGYDDTKNAERYLVPGAKIVYLADNCGEIVFDKLLCLELKNYGVEIIFVVKGEPILSDATLVEAEQIALGEVVDKIITTGKYAVGLDFKNIPPVLETALLDADLIVSKGMANLEALSETNFRPIWYLLRTKCNPVSEAIGEPRNLNVAKIIN
ncbi:damage-control phosphatase ARMT1 family protein [[Eubacterium] cellulosolvens]